MKKKILEIRIVGGKRETREILIFLISHINILVNILFGLLTLVEGLWSSLTSLVG